MINNIWSHLIRTNISCNENYSFCNVTPETEPNFREKSVFEILFLIKQFIKKEGWEKGWITLSWGEPLLRKDLDIIVLWMKKLWVKHIGLQTNASLLSHEKAEKLIQNGTNQFFISFHSHKQEIFEKYVWLKWIFSQVIKNIKNLWTYKNIEVSLTIVISKENYKDLEGYFDFIKREFPFIKDIFLVFIQPHGKAKENIGLMLDYEIINLELTWILGYANNLWFILNNPYYWLPICIMWWDKYNKNCIEVVENKILMDSWSIKKDKNKSYVQKCETCIYKWLCWWIWNEYIELYGSKWINCINSY